MVLFVFKRFVLLLIIYYMNDSCWNEMVISNKGQVSEVKCYFLANYLLYYFIKYYLLIPSTHLAPSAPPHVYTTITYSLAIISSFTFYSSLSFFLYIHEVVSPCLWRFPSCSSSFRFFLQLHCKKNIWYGPLSTVTLSYNLLENYFF